MLLTAKDYEKLRQLRKDLRLSCREIAEMIGYNKNSVNNIAIWLTRNRVPLAWELPVKEKLLSLTKKDILALAERRYQARLARNKN